MKKLLYLIFILISLNLSAHSISLSIGSGYPIGEWGYALDSGYSLGINYNHDYSRVRLFSGIEVISMPVHTAGFTVNMLHIPAGIDLQFFDRSNFILSARFYGGLTLIEKRILYSTERGINELLGTGLMLRYVINENNAVGVSAGYNREKIINGGDYVYLDFIADFKLF